MDKREEIVEVMARAIGDRLEAEAALSALEQKGYAIVPVEPSEEMLKAAHQEWAARKATWEEAPLTRLRCSGVVQAGRGCGNHYGHVLNGRPFCAQHWYQAFPEIEAASDDRLVQGSRS